MLVRRDKSSVIRVISNGRKVNRQLSHHFGSDRPCNATLLHAMHDDEITNYL